MKAFRVLVFAIICCVASGCFGASQPTPLLDGILSRQSVAQVKSHPKMKGRTWKVGENNSLKKGDSRPRFDILNIESNGYKHLGFPGTVTLQFFNNRLWSTHFHPLPSVRTQYINALSQATGTKLSLTSRTRLGSMEYHGPSNLVIWSDQYLEGEINDWVNRYA